MTALLAFQLRRVGRNRQYLLFTVLLPALFTVFFVKVFGGQAGSGARYQDFAATYMVSMMAYGALGAALGATIRIAFDRASGWLRQLHVLPVPTSRVFAVDVIVGGLLTLPSLLVVALVGRFITGVDLPLSRWIGLVGVLWLGSVAFVALGLLVGLALDEKAAGGAIGFLGVVLAALGGLWVPVEIFPAGLRDVAHGLPSYWYAQLGRDVAAGSGPSAAAVLALAGFTAVFAALAVLVARRRPLHAVSG
jgi:ABC-2 type transport system permease protein